MMFIPLMYIYLVFLFEPILPIAGITEYTARKRIANAELFLNLVFFINLLLVFTCQVFYKVRISEIRSHLCHTKSRGIPGLIIDFYLIIINPAIRYRSAARAVNTAL